MQLLECFPHCAPDDSELPQFVCGECYQLIDITYQFSVRTRRTEVLLRTYVHMGGDFPVPETLEAEYRRNSKRSASPDKQEGKQQPQKKRRSSEESSTSMENKERKSSKHKDRKESSKDNDKKDSSKDKNRKETSKDNDKKESSKDKNRKERKSSHRKEKDESTDKSSKRSSKTTTDRQKEQHYRSDEYLFGEVVELDPVEKRNDSIEEANKNVPDRVESIAKPVVRRFALELACEPVDEWETSASGHFASHELAGSKDGEGLTRP
ncbi:AAEL005164-PA [Aedes aegypti]|uniref:AAEL005164-PA n=1 Tax=Aedes aegypti TaxID=7159 RepID=Q17AW4_AEDAE|nr:AAEL005164-PA [Aedes aegypti]